MNAVRHNLAARLVAAIFLMVAMFATISPLPAAADATGEFVCTPDGRALIPRDAQETSPPYLAYEESVPTPVNGGYWCDGAPSADTDGDGINDDVDACPEVPGVAEYDGCNPPPPVDSDGDGIPDDQDGCPDAAGPGSNNGCPIVIDPDADGDGIPDTEDACPSEYGEDGNGCPEVILEPVDADGDGVNDDVDQCPGTTAGTEVDANGCAVIVIVVPTDTDGDGVNDDVDQCDDTPNMQVDNRGCGPPDPEHSAVPDEGSYKPDCRTNKVAFQVIEYVEKYVLVDGQWVFDRNVETGRVEPGSRLMSEDELVRWCQPDTEPSSTPEPTVVPTREPVTTPEPTAPPIVTPEPANPPADDGHNDHDHTGHGGGYDAAEKPVSNTVTVVKPVVSPDTGVVITMPVTGDGSTNGHGDDGSAFFIAAMWATISFFAAVYVRRRRYA